MLSVDPSKILSTLVKRGGLLIPDSVEKEIDALKQVLHVEEAELNLIEKQLILYNFTIALKGHKNNNNNNNSLILATYSLSSKE